MQGVDSPTIHAENCRIEYIRGALTEWYTNSSLGIEQGFTIAAPPLHPTPEARLAVAMTVAGDLTPSLDPSLTHFTFTNPATGHAVCRYENLHAFDATGRHLPAEMQLAGSTLSLLVDTCNAQFPLTIDPLIFSERTQITANDGATEDYFGRSVAIFGNTVVVGADTAVSGEVYWF